MKRATKKELKEALQTAFDNLERLGLVNVLCSDVEKIEKALR